MKKNHKENSRRFWKLGLEEYNTQNFDINTDGELIVREGNYQYNIFDIVKKYGTSTEIFFPTVIENRVRDVIETFTAYIKILGYRGKYHYHYAMKANQRKEYVLPAIAEGANLDVASANELYLVKRMIEQERFNKKIRVNCNGPKTDQYMTLIEELRNKGLVVIPIIEDWVELERMKKFKGEVGVRVNLDVRVKSHWDKKYNRFGFSENELLSLGKIRNLSMLHYHISSQIENIEGFVAPLKRALHLYAKMRMKNPQLDTVDIGGGAGIPYEKNKRFYSLKSLINRIVRTAKVTCDSLGVRHPHLITEWGRYVAAPAQITIYKIIAEKLVEPKTKKKWYTIDGSFMNDLIDTWAIHQQWYVIPVNNLHSRNFDKVWIAGASCDSDDVYKNRGHLMLPRLSESDELYIAVLDTGAYQDALASHHCLLSSPAKLMAVNGNIQTIQRRETSEEIGKMFGW